jgi:hypothetical protein
MEANASGVNRKILFLHPQAVVQDELVRASIAENFEAYLLRNHVSAKMALRDFPDAILLIQVDSGLDEQKWIEYAEELKLSPVFSELTICVVSVCSMDEIRKTFLEQSNAFAYGFTYSRYDFGTTYANIKEMYKKEKVNPPGFVIRGTSPDTFRASVVFTRDKNRYEGRLKDISLSGLTCTIEGNEPLYPSEIPIQSIIITYGRTQFMVSGRIVGNSGDDDTLHVILFDEMTIVDKRDDIYDTIQTCLQSNLEYHISEKSKKQRLVAKPSRSELYRKK